MTRLASAPADLRRQVDTRFGIFDVNPSDLVHFPDGLPGFEQCRRYVVLSSPDIAPLQCLASVEGPEASFLTIDPRLVVVDFTCPLSAVERRRLNADDATPLLWLAIVTVLEGDRATVNLRAPVVINPASMLGCQALPPQSPYPLRHPLVG